LAQAFPEESAGAELEKPLPEAEKTAEAQAVELTGLFAEMERAVSQTPSEPEALASPLASAEQAVGEPEAPKPETQVPDLAALFSEVTPAPAREAKAEKPQESAEPQMPEPEAKKEEPKEDAVSSFQAWLRSIQG